MHSPETVAFEIYLGRKRKKNGRYKSPFITIWHIDPEKDGTDDSCGWFIRSRHFDKSIIERTIKDFDYEWDRTFTSDESKFTYNCGWFNPQGENILSVRGIVLNMFIIAAKQVFSQPDNPEKMWTLVWRFIEKNYASIMYFAENNVDSMRDTIVRKWAIGCGEAYTPKKREEMIAECANIVCSYIVRKNRKWYQHPRWHFHHWGIQFHPFLRLRRRYWDKCSVCGKRGFKGSAHSDWNGTKIWHEHCNNSVKYPQPPTQQ